MLTLAVHAHKQIGRVLLECQSGILVFFVRIPQNMYVRELHVNDRLGSLIVSIGLSSCIRLSSSGWITGAIVGLVTLSICFDSILHSFVLN